MNTGWSVISILKSWAGKKQLSFSAVPSTWINAAGTFVFWPNNQQETLRQDSSSVPENEWKQYHCFIKKKNILTYEEALLWEQEFIQASDTEAEER